MGQTSCNQRDKTLDLIYQDLKNTLAKHDSPEEQLKRVKLKGDCPFFGIPVLFLS